MTPDELGISLTAKAPVYIGQRVPLDALATLSLARMLNLGWNPRPIRCGHSVACVDGRLAEPLQGREQSTIVDTHRQSSRVDRATDRRSNTRSRLDQLAPAIVLQQPSPRTMIHAVQADRHPAAAELTYPVPRRGCRGIRADRRRRRTTRQGPERDTLGRSRQRVARWRAGDGRRMSSDERGRERQDHPEHECRLDERKGVVGKRAAANPVIDAANAAASVPSGLPLVRAHDRAGEGFGR